MASLTLPDGYRIERSSAGYALTSPYGPLGDDFDCWACACHAAQDHADDLAREDAEAAEAAAEWAAEITPTAELSRAA